MRNVLLASAVAFAALLPATGCVPFGCGAYEGADDRVYARNSSEMLIVCGNGGFVANLESQSIEGRIEYNSDGTAIGVKGDDASLAFDWIVGGDTATTPQLGDGAWTYQSLDQTALDHADVLCQDLETRTWWAQQ
ncbi:MAG TPA: hypothetical protein VMZ53_17395 [Kofleriaceae bacterium]|nr:hypothetical protein [Kofleriaceae bacterium]